MQMGNESERAMFGDDDGKCNLGDGQVMLLWW